MIRFVDTVDERARTIDFSEATVAELMQCDNYLDISVGFRYCVLMDKNMTKGAPIEDHWTWERKNKKWKQKVADEIRSGDNYEQAWIDGLEKTMRRKYDPEEFEDEDDFIGTAKKKYKQKHWCVGCGAFGDKR